MAGVLVAEYLFNTCLASPADEMNRIYNVLIGVRLFLIVFFKCIIKLFKTHIDQQIVDRLLDI